MSRFTDKRQVVNAEVAGDMGDRAAGVEDHPGTAIEQLFGVSAG